MIRKEITPLQELAKKLLDALPMYGRVMLALLLNPKAAVLEQDLESDSAVQQALTFVAVSFGIAFIAQIPFLPEKGNKEILFGVLAVQSALSFALNVALAILAWKLVGGRLAWKKFFVATCYFSSVSTILFLAVYLVAAGTFKSLDPVGFQQLVTDTVADPLAMQASTGFRAFAALIALAFLVTYLWIFLVWGAYRHLLQLTRLRSAIAFVLFLAFTPILFTVQLLLARTMSAAKTQPAVPAELVGNWEMIHPNEENGIPSQDILAYQFLTPSTTPTGTYFMFKLTSSVENRCLLQLIQQESGRIVVQGSHLTLIPHQRTQSTGNSCTGKSANAAMDLSKTEYQFRVDQQPTGWILCLNDRFGQTCLSPKKAKP